MGVPLISSTTCRRLVLASMLTLALQPAPAAAGLEAEEPLCRAGLILAIDESASVQPEEWRALHRAHADAFRRAELRETILADPGLVVMVAGWSVEAPRLDIPWRLLDSEAAIEALAAAIEAIPDRRPQHGGRTHLDTLLEAVAAWAEAAPCLPAARFVLDVATDGKDSRAGGPGDPTREARDRLLGGGAPLTINAIIVPDEIEPDAPEWLEERLVGGAGGFLAVAAAWADYPAALARKLRREIAAAM
jgi:Ca-activated chloride channel family protein